jgi:UDP-sulfoquinovose synthase
MTHVLILGGDGYLGWPTAMYFSKRGYQVTVMDNYFRRNACRELDTGMLYSVPSEQRSESDKHPYNFYKAAIPLI